MAKRTLTAPQQVALSAVAAADKAWRDKKLTAAAEAKIMIEEALAKLDAERVRTVRAAFDLGVPKARIRYEGLHTSDPGTVNKILNESAEVAGLATAHTFSWVDRSHSVAKVNYLNFPTTSLAPDYPTILTGVVQRDGDRWTVLSDETDQGEGPSFLPGHLRWEMEQGTGDGTLAAMLTEWADGL